MRLALLLPLLASLAVGLFGCASDPSTPSAGKIATGPSDSAPLTRTREPQPAPSATVAGPAASRHRAVGNYAAASLTGDYAHYPAAGELIDRLVQVDGFDRDYLNGVFSRVEREPWILDLVDRPKRPSAAGPPRGWRRYRAKFLTEDNIEEGVRFWHEHADALERAQERYGVPPEYVVAIIGVETHYGANVGKTRVINALATLAFDFSRRAEYFRGELKAFLLMARHEGLDPLEPVGSYAGAMGLGQFMPSSFRKFAVDFDGDGHSDLWDPADAIGSVANYLSEHGWQSGQAVAVRATARSRAAHALKADYETSYPLDTLAQYGLTSRYPVNDEDQVSLLRLDGTPGYEYWLGLHNFYVITRYNHSTFYAMAVHQLAQAVRERHERLDKRILTRYDEAGATGRESPDRL
jgi:membrane-bound lytic murein transglycosylase B